MRTAGKRVGRHAVPLAVAVALLVSASGCHKRSSGRKARQSEAPAFYTLSGSSETRQARNRAGQTMWWADCDEPPIYTKRCGLLADRFVDKLDEYAVEMCDESPTDGELSKKCTRRLGKAFSATCAKRYPLAPPELVAWRCQEDPESCETLTGLELHWINIHNERTVESLEIAKARDARSPKPKKAKKAKLTTVQWIAVVLRGAAEGLNDAQRRQGR